MNEALVNQLIENKDKKLTTIKEQQASLELVENHYASKSFGRSLNSGYLLIKWLGFLFLGIASLFFSIVLMVWPGVLTQDETLKQELIDDFKAEYLLKAEDLIENAIVEMVRSGREPSTPDIIDQLEDSLDVVILQEVNDTIKGFGVLLFLLAVFLIYTSRSARKLRGRNKRIREAQDITRKLIKQFREIVEMENAELEQLKQLKTKKAGQSQTLLPPDSSDQG